MKTLLVLLALLLPVRAGFSQEFLLGDVVEFNVPHGVVNQQFGGHCDESYVELNYVAIDSSKQHIVIWDLGRAYKEIETGGIFIGANSDPFVEVTVATSYVDYGNWWVVGHLTGKDGPSTYAYPFKTYSVKGARYIAVIREFLKRDGEPNEYGQARIDCVRVRLAHASVRPAIEVDVEKIYDWSDILGSRVFRGTFRELQQEFPSGVFIPRTTR